LVVHILVDIVDYFQNLDTYSLVLDLDLNKVHFDFDILALLQEH